MFIDARSVLGLVGILPFLTIFALLLYFIQNEAVRYQNRVKGLRGPRGLPIIGNLHQVSCHVLCVNAFQAKSTSKVYSIF